MTGFLMVASLLMGGLGQTLNRKKSTPTEFVKVAMALAGLVLAVFAIGPPHAFWGDPFMQWFEKAWLWVCAVPGSATLIGIHPSMKTDSQT